MTTYTFDGENPTDGVDPVGDAVLASEYAGVSNINGTVTYTDQNVASGTLAATGGIGGVNAIQLAFTAVGRAGCMFYFRRTSTVSGATYIARWSALSPSFENVGDIRWNADGTLDVRDTTVRDDGTTVVLANDTLYRAWIDVNRTAGTYTLKVYSSHSTTPLETVTGSMNLSTATTIAQLYVGSALAGTGDAVWTVDDIVATDDVPGDGEPAPTVASDVATFDLTITHDTDSAATGDRTYEIDGSGSVGTVSLTQTGGTSVGTPTESPTGVFTFADPGGTDNLVFDLDAGTDTIVVTIPRGGTSQPASLTYYGGAVGTIGNWG